MENVGSKPDVSLYIITLKKEVQNDEWIFAEKPLMLSNTVGLTLLLLYRLAGIIRSD